MKLRRFKKPLAVFTFVAVSLIIVVAAAAALLIRQVFNRIHIDPQAVYAATTQAVNETLARGAAEPKLQTMAALETMGADAKPFLPALVGASRESDRTVSTAALRAISAIDAKQP